MVGSRLSSGVEISMQLKNGIEDMEKHRKTCIIFVKLPETGKVKTRLAKGSSNKFALDFYRLCSESIIKELCK